MKIIYNNYIPFKGFKAINLFGFIFARKQLNQININHEQIHTEQQIEMLYIFFYIWYLIEWFIKLFFTNNAYKLTSFEIEAYMNQNNLDYINKRKHYSWLKYVLKKPSLSN